MRIGAIASISIVVDYVYALPGTGIGQSSSVILDQNTHIMITESKVKSVSNKAPLIFPLVPLQM